VQARNGSGNSQQSSQWSAPVCATPQAAVTAPTAPQGLTLTATTNSITATWRAPEHTGGKPIERYTATINGAHAKQSTTTKATFTGLQHSTRYSISVTATNTGGKTSPAASGSGTTKTPPAPTRTHMYMCRGNSGSINLNRYTSCGQPKFNGTYLGVAFDASRKSLPGNQRLYTYYFVNDYPNGPVGHAVTTQPCSKGQASINGLYGYPHNQCGGPIFRGWTQRPPAYMEATKVYEMKKSGTTAQGYHYTFYGYANNSSPGGFTVAWFKRHGYRRDGVTFWV
jgi:hypothetical protein